MNPVLTVTHYERAHFASIRGALLDTYAEVYAEEITERPFFSMEQFEHRLEGHAAVPGWGCVIGDVDGETVGYAYGFRAQSGLWKGLRTPVDPELIREDGYRTFALCEIMVRAPWRGQGIARCIHDELMAGRSEARAQLLVEHEHPRVRALYESWGYQHVGELLPFPDAPLYDAMVLDLR